MNQKRIYFIYQHIAGYDKYFLLLNLIELLSVLLVFCIVFIKNFIYLDFCNRIGIKTKN